MERARREGHATRQGIIHAMHAVSALAQGSLHDAQVEAETGLLLVENQHFIAQLLVAVAMAAHIERGELAAAAGLARTGEAIGIAEERTYVTEFITARGRLRIAQGQLKEGVADFLWCSQRLADRAVVWPSSWRAYAAPALAAMGDKQRAHHALAPRNAVARITHRHKSAAVPPGRGLRKCRRGDSASVS